MSNGPDWVRWPKQFIANQLSNVLDLMEHQDIGDCELIVKRNGQELVRAKLTGFHALLNPVQVPGTDPVQFRPGDKRAVFCMWREPTVPAKQPPPRGSFAEAAERYRVEHTVNSSNQRKHYAWSVYLRAIRAVARHFHQPGEEPTRDQNAILQRVTVDDVASIAEEEWLRLPGVGRETVAAIARICACKEPK
jgi:hypothetical protein